MPLGQVQVPFPDSTFPGTPTHSQESSGRMINCYIEPLGPAAPATSIYRRGPGLRNFGTTVRSGFRGAIEVSGTLFCAFNNRLVTLSAAGGVATDMGILTGSAKGFFARNQRSPTPDIVFCDPDGNYANFALPATINMNYDIDLPSPNSVCIVDGYFFFTIGDGRVFASDFNATNITALASATAEAKADGLTRGVSWAGALWLFGPSTTEVWSNAGSGALFPFARNVVIPRGIAGPYCVAGFEDNFSRVLVWVADDNTVVQADGYTPSKISSPDLDGLIERVTDKRQLELSCFISRGHAFLLLSSPTWSWVFDLNTNRWSERNSYLQSRSRITGGIYAFNKWLCGDTATGNIQEITNQVHTEAARQQNITGAVAGANGDVKLTVVDATQLSANVIVTGVLGTTEANGIWTIAQVDATHVELVNSTFAHAYVSGGIIADAFELPFRWRLESGAVENFPVGARVGRADFEFVTGVGMTTAGYQETVTNVADGGGAASHQIWVTIANTARLQNGDAVNITGVLGATQANGTWPVTVIDHQRIQLNGSTFSSAYVSGGIATLLSPLEPIETDPVVEISWSDDGGNTYYAPIRRTLGKQAHTRELVSLIACTGRSSWNARRWRLDISDPVYVGFMAAYQNISPKVSDIG